VTTTPLWSCSLAAGRNSGLRRSAEASERRLNSSRITTFMMPSPVRESSSTYNEYKRLGGRSGGARQRRLRRVGGHHEAAARRAASTAPSRSRGRRPLDASPPPSSHAKTAGVKGDRPLVRDPPRTARVALGERRSRRRVDALRRSTTLPRAPSPAPARSAQRKRARSTWRSTRPLGSASRPTGSGGACCYHGRWWTLPSVRSSRRWSTSCAPYGPPGHRRRRSRAGDHRRQLWQDLLHNAPSTSPGCCSSSRGSSSRRFR
jgi:hypothetical protein